MPVDRDALDALHQRMLGDLSELTSGPDWLAWLHTARQFHRYSPQNQMLLAAQGASGLVASYRTWQRIPAQDGGTCQVAKGEHGLTILAPMTVTGRDIDEITGDEIVVARWIRGFKAVKVFHQGQLVSPPALHEPPIPELLTGENRWQHVWAAVQGQLELAGYTVEIATRSPIDTWNGRTDFSLGEVNVSDHLEPPQRLKTLLHEWGHIALAHDTTPGLTGPIREVEAESVAYLIANTIGLDSSAYTLPYVAGWASGDHDLVAHTAQRVLTTTATMITAIEHELGVNLTPDIFTITNPPDADIVPLEPQRRHHTPSPPREPATVPGLPDRDPIVEAAPSPLRQVLTQLDTDDRALLMAALTDLDTSLDIATALCADAGLDAHQTADVLLRAGATPHALAASMSRTVTDTHGEHAPLYDGAPEAIALAANIPVRDVAGGSNTHPSQASTSPPPAPSAAEAILAQWQAMRTPASVGHHLA